MKVTKSTELKGGGNRITVEIGRDEILLAIKEDLHYKLGGQVEDVVASHVIVDAVPVYWCSVGQRWEDA